jgi:hypothetical protein
LKDVDTQSEQFKNYIKVLNLSSRTQFERLQDAKEQFKKLMPYLATLEEFEMKSLIHMIQSRSAEEKLISELASQEMAQKLAKMSEDENHALKNRYRHQRQTMDYADPKRMPVDERKVKDLLRNQHLFRHKMNEEVGTYQKQLDNPQMENGVLTYLNEAAYGDMRALLKDIGMNRDTIKFYNLQDIRDLSKNQLHESDGNFKYLMNALFTPIDMTDYEEDFVGWNELPGALPINNVSWLSPLQEEPHPQTDRTPIFEEVETRPISGTSPTLKGILEANAADIEPEDDTAYGAEGDDEYGDYGDYGAEGEEEYGDYGPEEIPDDPAWEEVNPAGMKGDDRFFVHKSKLMENYNEVEIGAFMKLLSVKPYRQW